MLTMATETFHSHLYPVHRYPWCLSLSKGWISLRMRPASAAMATTCQLLCHSLGGLSCGVPPWPLHRATCTSPSTPSTSTQLKSKKKISALLNKWSSWGGGVFGASFKGTSILQVTQPVLLTLFILPSGFMELQGGQLRPSPGEELRQQRSVLLNSAFASTVREIEDDAAVQVAPDHLVLGQPRAVHFEKHRTACGHRSHQQRRFCPA